MTIKNNLSLTPITKKFSDSKYITHLRVCENPQCNCGTANIIITEGKELITEKVKYIIPTNVHTKKLDPIKENNYFSSKDTVELLRNHFQENLTEDDWGLLNNLYFEKKLEIIEDVNINAINFEFSDDDMKSESMLFPYAELFGASFLYIDIGDETYTFHEFYCKNPKCKCADILIDIIQIRKKDRGKRKDDTFGTIDYNYKTERKTITSKHKKEVENIFIKLNEKYDLQQIYAKRNKLIRELYKKEKTEYYSNKTNATSSNIYKNVKRNAPCPCGSGKKFKKCCLKKLNI